MKEVKLTVVRLLLAAAVVFGLLQAGKADVKAAVDSGTGNDYRWVFSDDYTLTIYATTSNAEVYGRKKEDYPWHSYRASIKKVVFSLDSGDFKKIYDYCFADCTNLTAVSFLTTSQAAKNPEEIGDYAFAGCVKLKSIGVPDCVNSLGTGAFSGSGLTSFTWPRGVGYVNSEMFKDCKALASISFINFSTAFTDASISRDAFSGCTALTSVTIPEGISDISYNAFDGCSSLKTATFPSTLKTIMPEAFNRCIALESVDLTSQSQVDIWQLAFTNCTALKTVKLGDGVIGLGGYAFRNCTSLETINFPNSLTTIGAFDGCDSLKELTIPSSVTRLSYVSKDDPSKVSHAIQNCKNLEKIVIPATVTVIKPGFLAGCPKAVIYTTAPSAAYSFAKENGFKVVPQNGGSGDCGTNLYWFFDDSAGSLVVGGTGGMKDFDRNNDPAPWVLQHGSRIKSITIESGVTSIGKDAFANLSSATSIEALPATVESIGDTAFMGCTGLSEISIPANVETIGKDVFKGDASLSINTTDGSAAADYAAANGMTCAAKTSAQVKAEGGKEEGKKPGADGKTDDQDAITFSVKGLTYKVTKAGDKGEVTLTGITSKKKASVTVPATVKYEGVKYDVTAIGESAFAGCKKLKTINIKSLKLGSVGANTFKGINKKAVIKVPKKKKSAYKKLFKKKGQAKSVKIK